jgi:hypothetical protein
MGEGAQINIWYVTAARTLWGDMATQAVEVVVICGEALPGGGRASVRSRYRDLRR